MQLVATPGLVPLRTTLLEQAVHLVQRPVITRGQPDAPGKPYEEGAKAAALPVLDSHVCPYVFLIGYGCKQGTAPEAADVIQLS